jgi:hypothetical protein
MALLTVRPTKIDEEVAGAVAAHTDRRIERNAEILTWGRMSMCCWGLRQ